MLALCIDNSHYNSLLTQGKLYIIKESSIKLNKQDDFTDVLCDDGRIHAVFVDRFKLDGVNKMQTQDGYIGQTVIWTDVGNWPYSPSTCSQPLIGSVDIITEIQNHSFKLLSTGDNWFFSIRFEPAGSTNQNMTTGQIIGNTQQYDLNLDNNREEAEENTKDSLIDQRRELKRFLLG